MRGVEIVTAKDQHRHAVAPGVVDRHGGVLQADHAVNESHQRLAGRLEIAVAHADRGFLVHAGQELRHRVLAVVDQRLVDPAIARGRIGRHVLDVECLDDVDHEVGAWPSALALRHRRRAGFRWRRHRRSAAAPTAAAAADPARLESRPWRGYRARCAGNSRRGRGICGGRVLGWHLSWASSSPLGLMVCRAGERQSSCRQRSITHGLSQRAAIAPAIGVACTDVRRCGNECAQLHRSPPAETGS